MSSTHDIQAILQQAATCPAGEIAGLLDRECGNNAALRAEVESLLNSVTAAGRFMASPTAGPDERGIDHGRLPTESGETDVDEGVGARIGPYKLLQRIGEGGFGSVYMAEQESPVRRKVALKIIKLGMDTRQVIARFEAERQALAMMNHPNIARVLDAGATDSQSPLGAGRPYFVMELVHGVPITRFCDENRLTVKQRLELFAEVCRAVQHAHTKGIIHRDIKPSNVMVTMDDDRPLAKVIDFGIAKATGSAVRLTDKTLFTEYQQFIGTPEYMSPEQAQMSATDVDTRSDVYSLGVLLYELLTGVTPFDREKLRRASLDDVRRIITEVQPPTPSTRFSTMRSSLSEQSAVGGSGSGALADLRGPDQGSSAADIAGFRGHNEVSLARTLRGDLDWIVMKCLEKDRTRRYETANGLAMDVGRYLTNEPVEAGPPSRLYLAKKFMQRNRTAVIAASLVAVALVLGIIGTSAGLIWAKQRQEETEQIVRFQSDMLADLDASEMGKGLRRLIEEEHEASLQFGRLDEQEIQTRRAELERALDTINFTNVASHSLYESIFDGALQAVEEFGDMPLVQAGLFETVATRLTGLSMAKRAVAPRERALEIYRRELGDDHPDTIRAIIDAAMTYRRVHRWDDVLRLTTEAAQTARRELDIKNPLRSRAISCLGNIYLDRWDLDEALRCFREVLEAAEPHDSAAMTAEFRIARVLWNQEDYAGAESIFREQMEYLGDDAWIAHYDWLGRSLSRQGKLDEAVQVLRIAVERAEHEMGSASRHAQIPKNFLMGALGLQFEAGGDRSKLEESLEIGSTLLRDARKSLRSSGPGFEWFLETYAYNLVLAGQFKDAEERLQEAVEMVQSKDSTQLAYGPTHFLYWAAEGFIKLYDAWHAAEPDAGHDVQAAEWRTRREWLIVDDVRVCIDKRAFKAAEDQLRESIDRVESDDSTLSAETTARLRREWAEVYVELYDAWHAAEPDAGYDIRAAEWRARGTASEWPESGGDEDR